jgi:hypothetical protein
MKIATFNINNINKRLSNLLEWLGRRYPDVALRCADVHLLGLFDPGVCF